MLTFDCVPNTFHQGRVCTADWTASGAQRNSCQSMKDDAGKMKARSHLLLGFDIHISYTHFSAAVQTEILSIVFRMKTK